MGIFEEHSLSMARLTDLKILLAKRILDSSDEEQLRLVDELLDPEKTFTLTDQQKKELDADLQDHIEGKGHEYSWNEVKGHARRKRSK